MTSSDQSIINQNSPDSIAKKVNSFIDNLNTKSILVIVLLIFLLNSLLINSSFKIFKPKYNNHLILKI